MESKFTVLEAPLKVSEFYVAPAKLIVSHSPKGLFNKLLAIFKIIRPGEVLVEYVSGGIRENINTQKKWVNSYVCEEEASIYLRYSLNIARCIYDKELNKRWKIDLFLEEIMQ